MEPKAHVVVGSSATVEVVICATARRRETHSASSYASYGKSRSSDVPSQKTRGKSREKSDGDSLQ